MSVCVLKPKPIRPIPRLLASRSCIVPVPYGSRTWQRTVSAGPSLSVNKQDQLDQLAKLDGFGGIEDNVELCSLAQAELELQARWRLPVDCSRSIQDDCELEGYTPSTDSGSDIIVDTKPGPSVAQNPPHRPSNPMIRDQRWLDDDNEDECGLEAEFDDCDVPLHPA